MKSPFMTLLSITLLSGCAYQQGVLEDRASEKAAAPSSESTTIQTPTQPTTYQPHNNTATAHKIIAPLTGR